MAQGEFVLRATAASFAFNSFCGLTTEGRYDQNAIGNLGTCQGAPFSVIFQHWLTPSPRCQRSMQSGSLEKRNRAPKMTVKKTILCVDDEQSLSIHKVTLETRGYRVLACNTAAEAMHILAQGAVDLVLSNVDLPDAPSPELVRSIKACSAEIPVVLLSSHKRVFHTDAPVDLLLRKGTYAPAELLERIRLLLMKRRGPRRAAAPPTALEHRAPAC